MVQNLFFCVFIFIRQEQQAIMGIHGLRSFLRDSCIEDSIQREIIPYGSVLNVDAFGWLFHLMLGPEGLEISRQYGGDYFLFDNLIRKSYYELLDLGCTLHMYFDGGKTQMKAKTLTKRKEKRNEEWLNMYNASLGGDTNLNQKVLIIPPLTRQQFIYTLTALGVSLINCDCEADQAIALACLEGNKCGRLHFCYGADSDFFVMRNCPYIEIGTINTQQIKDGCNDAVLTAVVWRRVILSSLLDMTEHQLVEWCMLIGNDYTEHYGRECYNKLSDSDNDIDIAGVHHICEIESDFGSKVVFPPSYWDKDSLEILRKFIVSKGPLFQLSSDVSELSLAIQFSRCVYELEDITGFLYDGIEDPVSTENMPSDDRKKENESSLSTEQKEQFRGWKSNQSLSQNLTSNVVGSYVLKFLRFYFQGYENGLKNGMEINVFKEINQSHLDALSIMLKNLSKKISDLRRLELSTLSQRLSAVTSKPNGNGDANIIENSQSRNGNHSQNSTPQKVFIYLRSSYLSLLVFYRSYC